MRGFCRGGRCWDDGWGLVDDARCSLFGDDEPFDGFERNAKKEEERDGVEDDVDGVCGLLGGVGDMVEEEPSRRRCGLTRTVSSLQSGGCALRTIYLPRVGSVHPRSATLSDSEWPTTMGVKSLWKLLTPVGRPVLYFLFVELAFSCFANSRFLKPRNSGG